MPGAGGSAYLDVRSAKMMRYSGDRRIVPDRHMNGEILIGVVA